MTRFGGEVSSIRFRLRVLLALVTGTTIVLGVFTWVAKNKEYHYFCNANLVRFGNAENAKQAASMEFVCNVGTSTVEVRGYTNASLSNAADVFFSFKVSGRSPHALFGKVPYTREFFCREIERCISQQLHDQGPVQVELRQLNLPKESFLDPVPSKNSADTQTH